MKKAKIDKRDARQIRETLCDARENARCMSDLLAHKFEGGGFVIGKSECRDKVAKTLMLNVNLIADLTAEMKTAQ